MSEYPTQSPQSFNGKKLIALGILFFCALSVLIALFSPLWNSGPNMPHASSRKKQTVASSVMGSYRLVQVTLSGAIDEGEEDPVFLSRNSAASVLSQLNELAEDGSVRGVLLRINSPGGTVGMSQELYNAVMRLRKLKPIVVIMGDMAASGGYYMASAADVIVASPGTLTASIGVIMHSMNMENLLTQKLGVKPLTIKSGRFKDILSPYRSATPDDLAMLQHIIDASYDQFIGDVLKGRTLDMTDDKEKATLSAKIRSVADGRVVLGTDAIKYGLVDKVGDTYAAIDVLKDLAAKHDGNKEPQDYYLDSEYGKINIWDEILQSNLGLLKPTVKTEINFSKIEMMPKTFRYANQPLWLMETLN